MNPPSAADLALCDGCGLATEGGEAGCQALFDRLIERDFSNALFFRHHRLAVDTYSLQHPERYCKSGKSFAAHLVGLQKILEANVSSAVGDGSVQKWLNGSRTLDRPDPPRFRGKLTIADAVAIDDPEEYGAAVRKWAESTWDAYQPLHDLARTWAREAHRGH